MAGKLAAWNGSGQQAGVLKRLQAQLGAVCGKAPAAAGQRAACESVLKATSAAKKSA
jgi:hypothetical protein